MGLDTVKTSMRSILVAVPLFLLALPAAVDAAPRAAVELSVYPAAVDPVETPRAILTNTGDVLLAYGTPFKLERRTSHGWRWINRRQAWSMPRLFLEPGWSSRPERIGVWRKNPDFEQCPRSEPCCVRVVLRPGLYRVTKFLSSAAGNLTARGTFRVLEKPTGAAE